MPLSKARMKLRKKLDRERYKKGIVKPMSNLNINSLSNLTSIELSNLNPTINSDEVVKPIESVQPKAWKARNFGRG